MKTQSRSRAPATGSWLRAVLAREGTEEGLGPWAGGGCPASRERHCAGCGVPEGRGGRLRPVTSDTCGTLTRLHLLIADHRPVGRGWGYWGGSRGCRGAWVEGSVGEAWEERLASREGSRMGQKAFCFQQNDGKGGFGWFL